MNTAPWHFDTREPSTASSVTSEADILKAADALAYYVEWHDGDLEEAMWLVAAYRKTRKGERE